MTFDDLMARAAEPTLHALIGRPRMRLLRQLDPELTQPDRLRDLVLELRPPAELLSDAAARNELVQLLPPDGAKTLVDLLELAEGSDPYAALAEMTVRKGSR